MKIMIDKDFYIKDDYGSSVILVEITTSVKNETGEEYKNEKIHGYFANVESAIRRYIIMSTRRNMGEVSLSQYIKEMDRKFEEVKHLIKGESK